MLSCSYLKRKMSANYTTRALDELTSHLNKKHYDSNIYTVFSNHNFNIKVGNTEPKFICYIKHLGEQFGDPLPYSVSSPTTVVFRCTSQTGTILVNETMTEIDTWLGEWKYTFSPFDFQTEGEYMVEIILSNPDVDNVIGKSRINVS